MDIRPETIVTGGTHRSKKYIEYFSNENKEELLKCQRIIHTLEVSSRKINKTINEVNEFFNDNIKMKEHHQTYNIVSDECLDHSTFTNLIADKKLKNCKNLIKKELLEILSKLD